MKRVISVLMCVVLLATAIPFSVFAEDEGNPTADQSSADAEQTAVLKGGSSVTNALLSASDTGGQQGEYFASIAGAELDGKTVNVRFDSTAAGSVVAALYSDDGLTMLASANAEFEGSDEAQFFKLELNIDSVPEYYILKVFLLGEDHKALCGNYTDLEHASAYADFMAKNVDDFKPELVVNLDGDNSNNFAVVKDGAVTPEHSETVNTVITNDYEKGIYVIGNATDDIKSLKKGDLLDLKYGESDLDAIVAVVSSVSVKGDTVTVTENKEAGLADYFDYVKINVENSAPAYTMDTDDLPEEIEYNGLYYGSPYDSFWDENALQPANSLNRKVGINLVNEKGNYNPNIVNKLTVQLSVTAKNGSISGTGSATAEIDFAVTSVEYKLYYDAKLWEKDTVVCNLILTSETKFIIKGEISGKVAGKVKIPEKLKKALKAEVPIFAGLYVVAGFYPVVSLELKGSFSVISVIKKSNGFRYNNRDGLRVVKTEEKENKIDCKVQVVLKIGLGFELGLKAGAPAIDHLSLTVSVFIEGGVKFTGEADQTAGSDAHPCTVCLKGTKDLFVKFGVRCKLKIIEGIEIGGELADELDYTQGKAYISLCKGQFSFALGVCPHIKYRVGITVVDENNKAISGAEITYNDDNNTRTVKTDSEGKADIYLPACSQKITAETDDASGSKTVTVKDKAQDITITVKRTDHSGGEASSELSTGTLVTFGSYPQSRVDDDDPGTLEKLRAKENSLTWTYYDYYCDGKQEDYMKYADVTLSDGYRYRAVRFSHYRPHSTTSNSYNSFQQTNGYEPDKVYWFRYDPIVWRVLDADTGLMMTENIIDSQPYHNFYDSGWGDEVHEHYASNWKYSSLKKWLNDDFYNTSFNKSERGLILKQSLKTPSSWSHEYDADPTYDDKVYLLDRDDVTYESYGFKSDESGGVDSNRIAYGTDYARCQGLYIYDSTGEYYSGASWWRLRTPYSDYYTGYVDYDGHVYYDGSGDTNLTDSGVRPATNIDLKSAISEGIIRIVDSGEAPKDISTGTLVTFGSYPQSEVKDEATKTALNSLLPEWDSWKSYGYYSGDGHADSGEPSDYMKYADVKYNGVKYRAVRFTSYRPFWTQGICSADNSYQDEYGYHTDTVYWFKYEPVVWRVLDPAKGLLMTESIIDSQAFENDYYDYNYSVYGDEVHDVYGDADHAHYASDWAYSSLRDWLNGCFLDTAFMNDAEKKCIKPTDLTTPSSDGTVYNAGDTKDDKVFLLSRDDALNESYGFSSSEDSDEDINRVAFGTDYAKCQGLWGGIVYYDEVSSYWRVRTPIDSNDTVDVADTGNFSTDNTGHACGGVRAALRVDLQSAISKGIIKTVNGKVSSPLKKSILTAAAETPAGPDAEKSKIGTLKYKLGAAQEKTVSHSKCIPGNEYVFICVKDPDADLFADGNLLYIDQKTAGNGIIKYTYKANTGTELFFGIFDDFTLGDVDGDDQIIAEDARLALRCSAKLETLTEIQMKAADVDGNGQVLADDARQILRFSAKLLKTFDKAQ